MTEIFDPKLIYFRCKTKETNRSLKTQFNMFRKQRFRIPSHYWCLDYRDYLNTTSCCIYEMQLRNAYITTVIHLTFVWQHRLDSLLQGQLVKKEVSKILL